MRAIVSIPVVAAARCEPEVSRRAAYSAMLSSCRSVMVFNNEVRQKNSWVDSGSGNLPSE
jgi:hypothetical protein